MFPLRSLHLSASVAFVSFFLTFAPHAVAQCNPPKVTRDPSRATVCAGSPASFSVTATGTAPLGYQWRKNGTDVLGATNATYSIAATAAADTARYDVVVKNACGSTASAAAILTVNVAPSIISHTSSSTVCAGSPVSFLVSTTGTAPLGYQWRKNGVDILGATSATYTIASAVAADTGSYVVDALRE